MATTEPDVKVREETITVQLPLTITTVARLGALTDLCWPGAVAKAQANGQLNIVIDPDAVPHPGLRGLIPSDDDGDEHADLSWVSTEELLYELRVRLSALRASAPGSFGDLLGYLMERGLSPDELAERRWVDPREGVQR